MNELFTIIIAVVLTYLLSKLYSYAERMQLGIEKISDQLEYSQFPVISFAGIERINEDIVFWNKWARKFRSLAKKQKSEDKAKEYEGLDMGCAQIAEMYMELLSKAIEVNAKASGTKSVSDLYRDYSNFRSSYIKKEIWPWENKIKEKNADLRIADMVRHDSKIIEMGYDI